MSALREAIVDVLADQMSMVDVLTGEQEDLLDAWNAVCEASPTVGIPEPITKADYDGREA